jgi:hypothetical protein
MILFHKDIHHEGNNDDGVDEYVDPEVEPGAVHRVRHVVPLVHVHRYQVNWIRGELRTLCSRPEAINRKQKLGCFITVVKFIKVFGLKGNLSSK